MEARFFNVKASKLGNRWDVSFHTPYELSLPRTVKRLEQMAQLVRGVSIPSRKYLEYSTKEGCLYIRISDIINGQIVGKAAKRILPTLSKVWLIPGDILLSIRGSIGKTALVTEEFDGDVPSSQLVVVRPFKSLVDHRYLFRILSSKIVQKQLDHIKVRQAISYVTIHGLRQLLIPLPPLQKQKEIVDRIEELEKHQTKAFEERTRIKKEIDHILEVYLD